VVTITAERSGGSRGGPVAVRCATNNGTATAGSDYTATSGMLTFGPGEAAKSFTVHVGLADLVGIGAQRERAAGSVVGDPGEWTTGASDPQTTVAVRASSAALAPRCRRDVRELHEDCMRVSACVGWRPNARRI
jgi:hypothetical protein